ncbi:MAG: NADH-quinone oxidoreductase subunit M, partial [Pseudomonadota bacterium]|nr:NADH-quinone oxidoreductase subunit M [Pseudomonadota bacterium]
MGALFILLIPGEDETVGRNARAVALWTTVATFILSIVILFEFDGSRTDLQFYEQASWLGGNIDYVMGVDGISVLFIILTTSLMPLCILASWESIKIRVREYMVAFLVLETLMIGV